LAIGMDSQVVVVILGTLSGLAAWIWGSSLSARTLAPTKALPTFIDRLGQVRPPNSVLNVYGAVVTLILTAVGPVGMAVRLSHVLQSGPIDVSAAILLAGIVAAISWAAILLFSLLRAPRR
jgi:hypothetical protein